MVHVHFILSQKEDMTKTFVEPTSYRAIYDLKETQGINNGESFRVVPVTLKFGHRSYKTVINGIEPDSRLSLMLDRNL